MQQHCKHAFLTLESLCFLRGPCKVVQLRSEESGFETPACRHMSLRTEELN
jgi:hypothetical protein